MQSRKNQSYIPKSDGGINDEPWAERSGDPFPASWWQGHGAPSADAPGVEGTWHTVVFSSPGAGDSGGDECPSPVLRMPEDSGYSNSPLTAWATGSPPPAEGPAGPTAAPLPSPPPHPRASWGRAWPACTHCDSQLENKGSKHSHKNSDIKLQPVPRLQWFHLRFF